MNSKKATVITLCVVTAITLALVVCIVIGVKNGQKEKNPVYVPPVTDTSAEQPLPVETPPVGTVTEPDTPTEPNGTEPSESETHDTDVYIDISEMTRNPEPEVVGGEIEYGTKD